MNTRAKTVASAILLSLPMAAAAHTGHLEVGFGEGLMHPFLGLDHLLAMLGVGIWSVLYGRRIWLAPLCFLSFLTAGAFLGQGGAMLPQLEPLVAASVLALGVMLAMPLARGTMASLAAIASFALCHGLAHGGELGAGSRVLAGILIGSAILHGAGMLIARHVLQQRPLWAHRVGQVVAVLGGYLLATTLL